MEYTHIKPSILDDQINGLIAAGYYPDKSELIKEALEYLFSRRHDLRLASAIELYREGKVTLSRAAEIAGMITEEFKHVLAERGFKITVEPLSDREFDDGLKIIKNIRENKK